MTSRTVLLLSLCMGPGSAFCRGAEPVNCPSTIAVRQELTSPVAAWTPWLNDAPHQLAGITFYDGPLAEKASLVYDQTTRAKGEEIATWRFTPQKDRQIWVACGYTGTAIELTRALPPGTNTCSVAYYRQQLVAGLPLIKRILCR